MKIVFISLDFLPDSIGGGEVHAYNLAKDMIANGHEIAVIRRKIGGQNDFTIEEHEFEGIRINSIRTSSSPQSAWARDSRLYDWSLSFFKEFRPDIAHVFLFAGMLSVIRAAKDVGIPIVMTALDFGMFCPRFHLLNNNGDLCDGLIAETKCRDCLLADYSLKQRFFFNSTRFLPLSMVEGVRDLSGKLIHSNPFFSTRIRSDLNNLGQSWEAAGSMIDLLIAPSEIMKMMYVQNGFPAEKVRKSVYGVKAPEQKAAKERSKDGSVRFGYIGRLHPSKGIDTLIEAFKGIKDENARLLLYGPLLKSDYVDQLKKLAESDQRISLPGPVSPSQVRLAQDSIDVLVSPSVWYENAPLTVLEAFQFGTPVICSDVAGMTEFVIDGINGLVFERKNVDSLRAVMQRLMDDPSLLDRLITGTRGIKNTSENAAEVLNIYSGLAHREPKPLSASS